MRRRGLRHRWSVMQVNKDKTQTNVKNAVGDAWVPGHAA